MAAVEVAPAPVQAVANGNHAEANGNMEHVAESVEQTEQTEQTEPEEPKEHRLYFVRIPRPTFDDSALKKLDAELGTCFTKLKAINNKAQVKRGEANELRKQLGVARSLRNGSSPEWEEKMTRLKQLREMRKAILDKIAEYKQGRQGLECRTEQELDDKIAEMEHAIQHGEMSLAEEKATVRNIAKLRGQREKIRELEGQQESLAQMEAEARKIKAVIDEVDSEMNILRGERDQAKDIIDDLQGKLTAVNAVLADYDAERQDLEGTKREIQDQLKTLREEIDSHMFEYRANRKLSLQLRDLVADGKLEDAQAMAQQQVEAQLSKMMSDVAYRKEYNKLWSEQRKYLVSELLPNSGAVEAKPAPAAAGKGGKKADRSAAPLVPQGAAKAQAIIAAALAEAELAVAAKRKEEPAPVHQDEETEEHSEEPAAEPEPAVRIVPGASEEFTAVTKSKASKPAYNYAKVMSEMPEVVHDYEYIMPPTAAKDTEQLSAAELKAKVREEQRQKAAEAEARKKRRQEQLAKKQALAKQKAAEQAAAAATAASTALAPVSRAAAVVAEEAEVGSGADGDAESGAEQQAVSQPKPKQRGKQHMLSKTNKQLAAAVKKPVVKKPVKVQKWYQQYSTELAIGGVCALMLILLILYFTQ